MRRPGYTCAVALLLPVAVVAAYWPALRGGFLWDDDAHVTRRGSALPQRTLGGSGPSRAPPSSTIPSSTRLSGRSTALWGDATLGYHLVNVALHLAACLLLYRVLRRLAVPGALFAVAVFALHPVCAETVAWISEQKNTLSTVFYLGAALAYLRFDAERKPRWYALGLGCFVLALLSKSVTATLPARPPRRPLVEAGTDPLEGRRGPACSLVCPGDRRRFVHVMGRAHSSSGPAAPTLRSTCADRLLVAGRALWFYLGKIVWPADLVFIYPRWGLDPGRESGSGFIPRRRSPPRGPCGRCGGGRGAPWRRPSFLPGRSSRSLGFVNVYPFVFSFVADHFQYLAALALIPALVAGAALAQARLPASPYGAGAAAGCILALLAFLTARQARLYEDSEVFYRGILRANPGSWLAHDNLGVVLAGKGRWDEASAHYREAIRLKPDYPESYNDFGNVLARAGRWDEAAAQYAQALRVRPSFAAAEKNWGVAMNDAGRYREAETHFRQALRLQPAYADAHYGLANALANSGRLAEAVAEFRATLRLEPQLPQAHANLGLAYAEQGLWADALRETTEAIRLRPGYAEAHAYQGLALAGAGRLDEAIAQYQEALRLAPGAADVHYQLALALRSAGRPAEAESHFETAARLGERR